MKLSVSVRDYLVNALPKSAYIAETTDKNITFVNYEGQIFDVTPENMYQIISDIFQVRLELGLVNLPVKFEQ